MKASWRRKGGARQREKASLLLRSFLWASYLPALVVNFCPSRALGDGEGRVAGRGEEHQNEKCAKRVSSPQVREERTERTGNRRSSRTWPQEEKTKEYMQTMVLTRSASPQHLSPPLLLLHRPFSSSPNRVLPQASIEQIDTRKRRKRVRMRVNVFCL